MLFSVNSYPGGSMRDWYLENSYGQFNVTGATTVWLRMPQPYTYACPMDRQVSAPAPRRVETAEDALARRRSAR